MCLDRITKRFPIEIKIGYKYFRPLYHSSSASAAYYSNGILDKTKVKALYRKDEFSLKEWYEADRNTEYTSNNQKYMTGFHIFPNITELKKYNNYNIPYVVLYHTPTVQGIDSGAKVILANSMLVVRKLTETELSSGRLKTKIRVEDYTK